MLHGEPQNAAEKFALHLEQAYGLQLDPYRHRQLVAELEEFTGRADEPDSTDEPMPSDPAETTDAV